MDRRERRDLFERLLALRAMYRLRSDYDARSEVAVDAAVDWGERLMRALRAAGPSVQLS